MQSVYFDEAKPFDSIVQFSTNRYCLSNPVASEFVAKVDGFFMHKAFTDQTENISSDLEERVAIIDLPLLLEEFPDIGARQRFIANFQKVTQKHFLFPNPNQQVFLTKSDPLPTSSAPGKHSLTSWLPKRWIEDASPLLAAHPRICRNDESTRKHDVTNSIVLSLGPLSPLAHALLQRLVEHPYQLDDIDFTSAPSLETALELHLFTKENKINDFRNSLEKYLQSKKKSLDKDEIRENVSLYRLFIQLGGKRSEDPVVKKLFASPHKTDLDEDFWKTCTDLAFEGQEISAAKRDKLANFIARLSVKEEEEEEATEDVGFGLFDDVAPTSSREPDFSHLQKFANENTPAGTKITFEDASVILKLLESLTSEDTDEIGVLKGVFPELKSE